MVRKTFHNRPFSIDGLLVKNQKLLLIKRGKYPYQNYWALPGGHVGFNETCEEALKRELKEETNLSLTSHKLLGLYSKPQRSPTQAISAVYVIDALGKPKAGDDAVDLKFFSFNKLPQNLAFDHSEIIKDYLKF
ncbi:NUDIX hydrolase [Candidatus Gottesmanbacteria bacterium]|nr:NUDIX hydrolase [Candidatus Gottesmanbacteria bacterium]